MQLRLGRWSARRPPPTPAKAGPRFRVWIDSARLQVTLGREVAVQEQFVGGDSDAHGSQAMAPATRGGGHLVLSLLCRLAFRLLSLASPLCPVRLHALTDCSACRGAHAALACRSAPSSGYGSRRSRNTIQGGLERYDLAV